MGPTESLAQFVVETELRDIPQEAIDTSKLVILDALGVTLAGSLQPAAKIITDYVRDAGAVPRAGVIGTNLRSEASLAALANGTMAFILDYDDNLHGSTHTLPAALALGEETGTSGKKLLEAYILGRDVCFRLDAALDAGRRRNRGGPTSRGWFAGGTTGTLAAAAAAGKVMGLGAKQMATAFGIAASSTGGLRRNFGSMAKALQTGNAARNGVAAVLLAKRGFTANQNILEELILLRGSGQTSVAILGGSIFAAPVTLPTVMLADLGGADLINVAHTVPGVQSKLVVKQEIKRPEDLKGKRIATSSLGSLGDFLNRYIMRKHGLDPTRDVNWLMIGTPPERLQALVAGNVEAADLSYPTDAQAERMGYRILWDFRKEVVYPSMSIVTRRKSIQEDRDTVMRMVKSHVEGIAHLKTHKDFSLKVLSKYLRTNDRELLEGSYDIYKQDFISTPYPIMKGLEATYDYVAQTKPEIRNRKPEEFVDPSFIAELDKSGFIKKLYEQK